MWFTRHLAAAIAAIDHGSDEVTMRTPVRVPLISACAFLLCGSLAAQDAASVDQMLTARYNIFARAYTTYDADQVASLYTEDALYLSPDHDIRRGREVIRQIFADNFAEARNRGDRLKIEFTIIERSVSDGAAVDIGYFYLTEADAQGATRNSRGKFAVVWRRSDDGVWRIHVDSYSGVE